MVACTFLKRLANHHHRLVALRCFLGGLLEHACGKMFYTERDRKRGRDSTFESFVGVFWEEVAVCRVEVQHPLCLESQLPEARGLMRAKHVHVQLAPDTLTAHVYTYALDGV